MVEPGPQEYSTEVLGGEKMICAMSKIMTFNSKLQNGGVTQPDLLDCRDQLVLKSLRGRNLDQLSSGSGARVITPNLRLRNTATTDRIKRAKRGSSQVLIPLYGQVTNLTKPVRLRP
jgi:hypothetical protein